MIGRRFRAKKDVEVAEPKGFDDFELRLGDMMRGERATMGKSLLDVERELRIKATYVAAIENADPDSFDTPGFIPGYVRSYARYLGMDPDKAFDQFCRECGFTVEHGMAAGASSVRRSEAAPRARKRNADPIVTPKTPFAPASESVFAGIEPGAIGSAAVLIALIGAIGYGGWSVLNEVQRVQFAPVENTPQVLSNLDPLDGAMPILENTEDPAEVAGILLPPADDRIDRLYRPEALDVPVMVARDAPISTLNPSEIGTLATDAPRPDRTPVEMALADAIETPETSTPQVVADPLPGVQMVAVRPAWVRVRGADGSVIFESIMNAGDSFPVPSTEEPPTLRVGESGAIYFVVNGRHYGPAGAKGSVTSNLPLNATSIITRYQVADLEQDRDLMRFVAEVQSGSVPQQ